MNNETLRKLKEMKLSAMAESYEEQLSNSDYKTMTFDDRFNLMVDQEYYRRKNNKYQRLLKQAGLVSPVLLLKT